MVNGLYKTEAQPEMPCGPTGKPGAYAKSMRAVVEHWSELEETRRARVGTAQLTQAAGKCYYVCKLHDDLLGTRKSEVFRHAPEVLQHWDLLARAVNWTDAKQWQLPGRPPLRLTQPFEEGGNSYVGLRRIAQPARRGFEQWLARQGITVARPADAPSGIVPEEHYAQFMSKAL